MRLTPLAKPARTVSHLTTPSALLTSHPSEEKVLSLKGMCSPLYPGSSSLLSHPVPPSKWGQCYFLASHFYLCVYTTIPPSPSFRLVGITLRKHLAPVGFLRSPYHSPHLLPLLAYKLKYRTHKRLSDGS